MQKEPKVAFICIAMRLCLGVFVWLNKNHTENIAKAERHSVSTDLDYSCSHSLVISDSWLHALLLCAPTM